MSCSKILYIFFLRQGLQLNLEWAVIVNKTGQWALRGCLSHICLPQHRDCHSRLLYVHWGLTSGTRPAQHASYPLNHLPSVFNRLSSTFFGFPFIYLSPSFIVDAASLTLHHNIREKMKKKDFYSSLGISHEQSQNGLIGHLQRLNCTGFLLTKFSVKNEILILL